MGRAGNGKATAAGMQVPLPPVLQEVQTSTRYKGGVHMFLSSHGGGGRLGGRWGGRRRTVAGHRQ